MYTSVGKMEHHVFGPYGRPHQGIYTQSSSSNYPVGTGYPEPGPLHRYFIYSLAGAAITPGKMLATAALSGADTTLQTACAVAVAADAGDNRIYITAITTAQVADRFKYGLAVINDVSTTPDDFYSIPCVGNNAIAASGTASYIDLAYGVPVALTTSDKVDLSVNPWYNVIEQPASTHTGSSAGVAMINVTSGYYFWAQTWGPVGIMSNAGPLTVGAGVVSSTDIAGGIASLTGGSCNIVQPQVGWAVNVSTDVYGATVFLTIARGV